MLKIPLRDFQLKPSLYLDKLPLQLTRYGEVVAHVTGPGSTQIPKNTKFEEPTQKKLEKVVKNFPGVCVHGAGEKMCRVANCKHYYAKK